MNAKTIDDSLVDVGHVYTACFKSRCAANPILKFRGCAAREGTNDGAGKDSGS